MVLFWEDNCIFCTNDISSIKNTLSLKYECILEQEEGISEFLGLDIERDFATLIIIYIFNIVDQTYSAGYIHVT